MPAWSAFEAAAPEFAGRVRAYFEAEVNRSLATLRRDGAPRISAVEVQFADGELWTGSMWRALKALDLRRDPRYALQSGNGDAKVAGVAEEILDEAQIRARNGEAAKQGPTHLFRLDIDEVSTVELNDAKDALIITVWTPDRGVRTIERR